ncbi:MAG TPA: Rmf/CrpP family protein [Streptosporangiaceae bacterium]|jgi:hypothetical protein
MSAPGRFATAAEKRDATVAGAFAARRGQRLATCPYRLSSKAPRAAVLAQAWARGWLYARPPARGTVDYTS